jgi:FkbM family methyltransferase
MFSRASDWALGVYGRFPFPHKGRDRLVAALSARAKPLWHGSRSMTRRGFSIETDFGADDVGRALYCYGCLDYWDEMAIRRLLKRGAICFDIGAHIGYYSLLFSAAVGPEGQVFSYEPAPQTFSFLSRNVAKNLAQKVAIHQSAVGDSGGTVQMACGGEMPLGWSRVRESGGLEVPCTTIDAEVSRLKLKRVDFVKVDVEGYEPHVLEGAKNTLARLRPTVMFEVNAIALREHGAEPTRISDIFVSHGYELFVTQKRKLQRIRQFLEERRFYNVFALPTS